MKLDKQEFNYKKNFLIRLNKLVLKNTYKNENCLFIYLK